jgi:hypothetical protein
MERGEGKGKEAVEGFERKLWKILKYLKQDRFERRYDTGFLVLKGTRLELLE